MKLILLAAGLFCILIAGSAVAEPVHFTFDPADSLTCTGITVTARTRFVDSDQGPIDSIRIYNQMLYTHTDSGYEVLSSPDSITITRNGVRIADLVTSVLGHTPITYVLDSTGQAKSVRGYEKVLDEVLSENSQLSDNMRRALNVDMLSAGALTEWDSRVGSMIGMELRLGETAHSIEEHVTPDGRSMPFYQIMQITDTFKVDGQLCARMFRLADTDFDRLANNLKMTSDSLKHIMNIPTDKKVAPPDDSASSWSSDQVVMEVHTMMILGEHSESETILPMIGPDGATHMVKMIEATDKEYHFGPRIKAMR